MEIGSMSNNLLHEVRKKAAIIENIRAQVQCKWELKDDTINVCQKIIVQLFDLSRGLKDATLSPHNFTPVSENFIQVLNKHWTLVFQGQLRQINIYDSLVTDKK